MNDKIIKVKQIVKKTLEHDMGHNLDHIMRVLNISMRLALNRTDIDLEILQFAVLLHDIARSIEDKDKTGKIDHAILGSEMAGKILKELKMDEVTIHKIQHCIQAHRIRSRIKPISEEAKILFDADKIDILGAVGITRMYMTAGQYGQRLYSNISIDEHLANTVNGEKTGRIKDVSKHSPNLEYEIKIRKIPERLFSQEAKIIARERIIFIDEFFNRLRKELKGIDFNINSF